MPLVRIRKKLVVKTRQFIICKVSPADPILLFGLTDPYRQFSFAWMAKPDFDFYHHPELISISTGKFLEPGTGSGLSASWILDGMDDNSTLVSIDNEPSFLRITQDNLGFDNRLTLTLTDGEKWV